MWPFKKENKVDISGEKLNTNPPSKSPGAIKRNEERIKRLKQEINNPKHNKATIAAFKAEISRRKALNIFWENS